jgi:perosamine synthetase
MKKLNYIPFHRPTIPKEVITSIKESLNSGWITTGPKVKKFEQLISKITNKNNVVATSSCTSALHTAYVISNIKKGDEVIVPSFTFCSTINMLTNIGAKPIFADIDEKSYCIDPKDIENRITKKTKAIVVVHYAGMPADMSSINKIARKYKILVIEDAAHAFSTIYKGKLIGKSKNITCFSFYATKNFTTAEGGAILCSNSKQEKIARMFINHGMSKNASSRYLKGGTYKYDIVLPGYKYNLSDIHASIGICQLPYMKKFQKIRSDVIDKYRKGFSENKNVLLPIDPPYKNSHHSWHLFAIQILPESKCTRDELFYFLKDSGIGSSVHYIPNHLQSFYRNKNKVMLPITEKISSRIISLPLYETLEEKDIDRVIKMVNFATKYGIRK